MSERERTALEIELADNVAHQIDRLVYRLRNTADRIEREIGSLAHVSEPGHAAYAVVAARVLDELRACNGNLMTSSLVEAAGTADAERIRTS
jgi:hypothetical protein